MNGFSITGLQVDDFKCFKQLRIPFASLTVLSGFNGAGKSTAIQPILLLAQAARRRTWSSNAKTGDLPLNGDIVRLGSAGDVMGAKSLDGAARFRVFGRHNSISLHVAARTNARSLIVTRDTDDVWLDLSSRLSRLVYLSAVRAGPAESFPTPDRISDQAPDVGADGRFASYWYHELADTEIDPARRWPGEPGTTLRKQLDAWLGRLTPGASANVQSLPVASVLALQFRLSDIGEWRRPSNIGYGLTYAFPILVALLTAEKGDVIVIDSPEAHLHPQAQSRMGTLLATFASAGVQIIVETHSDHILNGVRLAVRDRALDVSDLSLLFFAGTSQEGHGVTRPQIDSDGRIDEWPEGFFDQGDKDVGQLAGFS